MGPAFRALGRPGAGPRYMVMEPGTLHPSPVPAAVGSSSAEPSAVASATLVEFNKNTVIGPPWIPVMSHDLITNNFLQVVELEPFSSSLPSAAGVLAPLEKHFAECAVCYEFKVWVFELHFFSKRFVITIRGRIAAAHVIRRVLLQVVFRRCAQVSSSENTVRALNAPLHIPFSRAPLSNSEIRSGPRHPTTLCSPCLAAHATAAVRSAKLYVRCPAPR